MKTWQTKLLIVVIALSAIVAILVGSFISAHDYANKAETGIIMAKKNNMNILGQYTTKITEMVQVPSMMKDDLKEVIQAAIGGRYGSDGSKASWQWIKEHNPTIDPSLYTNIQQSIEAGRNKFENAQTGLLSRCQEYKTQLGKLIIGKFINLAGYPKENLDEVCEPIISTHAGKAYETGIDDGIKLR